MELDEFISTTLQQIVNGVKDAQKELKDNTRGVGPVAIWDNLPFEKRAELRTPLVHFDVAVTVSETSGSKAGGGIKVLSFFNAGGQTSKEAEMAAVSRITFDVPVGLPTMPTE